MKSLFSIIVSLILSLYTYVGICADYYVDANAAPDGNGTTKKVLGPNCAWDSISDINIASLSPGDTVYLDNRDTWTEALVIPSSGSSGSHITISSYGIGSTRAIIDGEDTRSIGINLNNNDYITIELLEIRSHTSSGILIDTNSNNIIVRRSYIHSNSTGIELLSTVSDVDIQNNIIVENSSFGIDTDADVVDIYHNTLYNNGLAGSHSQLEVRANSDTINIKNNIMYAPKTGGNQALAMAIAQGTSNIDTDYNIYYKTGSIINCIFRGGTLYTCANFSTVGGYQEIYDPQDANSLCVAPYFQDLNIDHKLNIQSDGIDSGLDVGIDIDYDGNRRPQMLGIDIGAYDYPNSKGIIYFYYGTDTPYKNQSKISGGYVATPKD